MPDAATPARILIVDDDQGLLRLMERTLKREGFVTATAGSGKDAIAWLATNTAGLMLLDLKLQDIEGKELINQLTSIARLVPFIVITAQGDERAAVEMMKRGALDYLVCSACSSEDWPPIFFVLKTVKHGLDRGFSLFLLRDALRDVNAKPGDGGDSKAEMIRLGAAPIQLTDLA